MEVFELIKVLDNPRFEGFGCGNMASIRGLRSILADFMPDSDAIDRHAPRLAPIRKPFVVVGHVRPENDYPCIALMIPAFSRRAVDALRNMLEPNGELLPLVSTVGEYYAYNPTTIADVLDRDRSVIHWLSRDPGPWDCRAMGVERFEFHADRLGQLAIFQLPELAGLTFVTKSFVERAQEAKLVGLNFVRVWQG